MGAGSSSANLRAASQWHKTLRIWQLLLCPLCSILFLAWAQLHHSFLWLSSQHRLVTLETQLPESSARQSNPAVSWWSHTHTGHTQLRYLCPYRVVARSNNSLMNFSTLSLDCLQSAKESHRYFLFLSSPSTSRSSSRSSSFSSYLPSCGAG